MKEKFVCKIASETDMNIKWDYEISIAKEDKHNMILWKDRHINNYLNGFSIPYYGILDGKIICEATAVIDKCVIQNSDGLIDKKKAYLMAFRTIDEYQGKGYFSKLFNFMIDDLKNRGIEKVTVGVEPKEIKNKQIYKHYGFNKYIKTSHEVYPDGEKVEVEYYEKEL